MDKKSLPQYEHLRKLCQSVETTFGVALSTPKQFEVLADSIYEHTGILLSPTTLKRIWGYLNEPVVPRTSTLDVLARYCGWVSFEAFTTEDTPEIESGNVGSRFLRVDKNLRRGERVKLMWPPARVCLIEYCGGGNWRVVASEGTRLAPGDTFNCMLIVEGEPLYLDNLVHEGCRPGVYVCGRRSGVKFIKEV